MKGGNDGMILLDLGEIFVVDREINYFSRFEIFSTKFIFVIRSRIGNKYL